MRHLGHSTSLDGVHEINVDPMSTEIIRSTKREAYRFSKLIPKFDLLKFAYSC